MVLSEFLNFINLVDINKKCHIVLKCMLLATEAENLFILVYFCEVATYVSCPFFNEGIFFLMICKYPLYILDHNPLSAICYTNIFFQFMNYFFDCFLIWYAFIYKNVNSFNIPNFSFVTFPCHFFTVSSPSQVHKDFPENFVT